MANGETNRSGQPRTKYVWIKCCAIWSWQREQYELVFLHPYLDDDGAHYESSELYRPALDEVIWKEDTKSDA